MKFGRRFVLALEEMHQLWAPIEHWPNINYKYHKAQIYMTMAKRGSHPLLNRLADLSGAEPLIDSAADDAFRRSLLADIAMIDENFLQHCTLLRALHDELVVFPDDAALAEGRNLLAVLNRWCALNYLGALKIVKKHDKSGRLRPLRAEVVSMLGRTAFVAALQTPAVFSALAGSANEHSGPSPGHAHSVEEAERDTSLEEPLDAALDASRTPPCPGRALAQVPPSGAASSASKSCLTSSVSSSEVPTSEEEPSQPSTKAPAKAPAKAPTNAPCRPSAGSEAKAGKAEGFVNERFVKSLEHLIAVPLSTKAASPLGVPATASADAGHALGALAEDSVKDSVSLSEETTVKILMSIDASK